MWVLTTEWLMTNFLFCFFFLLVIGIDVFTTHSTSCVPQGKGSGSQHSRHPRAADWSSISSYFVCYRRPVMAGQLAVGCFPQPLQCMVSFERYHVVN